MTVAGLLLAAPGCTRRAQPDRSSEGGTQAGARTADPTELPPSDEPKAELHAAARCAECHGELYAQWKESRHARAATSDLYLRTRKAAGTGECMRCHEPLARLVESDHPASRDGVNCDTCHTMAAVDMSSDSATFRLRPEERTKYGPLCDAVDHYFHKMGCSPLHGEAQFCAACHRWSNALGDGTKVRLLGEFDEWRESSYAKKAVSCQDCHMPWQVAPVAAGAATRVNASHHGFWGEVGDLRKRSLTVKTTIKQTGKQLGVELRVKNSGAGHYVPTGLPEHRVVLEATLRDTADRELDRAERVYAKNLVDDTGRPALFFSAAKQASDTRIAPDEERTETLEFALPEDATTVKVRLVWMDMASELARTLAYEPVREVMYEETHPLKGSTNRQRTTIPVMNR